MTCIVGIEDPNGTIIGGDGAYLSGWRRTNSANPKVFRLGPLAIGGCGSTRVFQVIQYQLELLDAEPTVGWMVRSFVPALRAALRLHGTLQTDKGVDDSPGTLLVGVRDRLFAVWSDFQVEPAARGYQAVGAGAEIAVGALHAMAGSTLAVRTKARRALMAAAEHSASVSPPFSTIRARG